MPARDIGWVTIAPNSATDWFIHGWGPKEAVTYAIVVFPGSGPNVPYPGASATLTHLRSIKWFVDGSFAHVVNVRNNQAFNSVNVHLIASVQTLE